MADKQKFFQIVLLIIFGATTVISVLVIAFFRSTPPEQLISGNVIIWGPPFEGNAVNKVLRELVEAGEESYINVTYVAKHPSTLYSDLVETISSGSMETTPDLVIINVAELLPLRNKLQPIAYEHLPMHEIRDTWVDGAEIFALDDGVYALPILVDPLVLYWNRDLFANEAIAQVPKDWDTFIQMVPRLTKIVDGADLRQSAVAFGEFDNVLHSLKILSALFMQTGVKIVTQDDNGFRADLVETTADDKRAAAAAAIRFYTSFANPVNIVYSWNKTYDRSREAFAANKVAMYAGLVSEENILLDINPNLNFGMSTWPQSNNSMSKVTYGDFYGLAVVKATDNLNAAYTVALRLTKDPEIAAKISEYANLPSTRRDVLTNIDPTDPFGNVKTQSAIMSHTWLMPPGMSVEESFARAINSVVSGTIDEEAALRDIDHDMNALLKKYNTL